MSNMRKRLPPSYQTRGRPSRWSGDLDENPYGVPRWIMDKLSTMGVSSDAKLMNEKLQELLKQSTTGTGE